jgi:hypothetical protein
MEVGLVSCHPLPAHHVSTSQQKPRCAITYILRQAFDRSKIDVILLDDTRVQRVEIHDKDVFVEKSALGFKHETTLVFVSLAFTRLTATLAVCVACFRLWFGRFLPVSLIRTNIFQAMELVQKNVLVPLSTATIQCFVPETKF